MITKLIIELLEYAVTGYKANEVFIDRTENDDLIIDWMNGHTPCVNEIFADREKPDLSPLGKLAACCWDMTVLAEKPETVFIGDLIRPSLYSRYSARSPKEISL